MSTNVTSATVTSTNVTSTTVTSTSSRWRTALLVTVLTGAIAACGTAAAGPSDDLSTDGPSTSGSELSTTTPDAAALPAVSGLRAMSDVDGRLATYSADGTAVVHDRGLVSADGAAAVVVDSGGGRTVLHWIALETGAETASLELAGDLVAVAATPDARVLGLVDDAGPTADGAIAPGRTTTEVVVASPDGEVFRREVEGNIVPEAFSAWTQPGASTPGAAFVIDHQPPAHPTHYRVRVLDLTTGELALPFNLRDKVQLVDQLMAGISRTSVVATDVDLLFTLYRGHHDEGVGSYAFIHTLAFGGGVWCLEVPVEMDLSERAGALAIAPDGEHLVAVSANGTIARIAVESIVNFERTPVFGPARSLDADTSGAPAVATGDDVLHVGLGPTLVEVDPVDLSVRTSVEVPVEVEAVDVGEHGVVAVGGGRVLLVTGGVVAGESNVPAGLGTIARVVAD